MKELSQDFGAGERQIFFGTRDADLVRRISAEILQLGKRCQTIVCASIREMQERAVGGAPPVIFLDCAIVEGASLAEALLQLTGIAPVVALAPADKNRELERWVASGQVEVITRTGDYASLAAAALVRRLRWAERSDSNLELPWQKLPPDFAEILRHEINNPLTGILGNAELVVAHHKEKLPAAALQRIETVVDLAVRLRETIRRLSNAWERRPTRARSA